ncbi:MAG: cation diffusion facilitator family transporter [Bacteroidota bacterium]|nr:cation diffusion facilitator family transporter [Bacteroidota bacterium]
MQSADKAGKIVLFGILGSVLLATIKWLTGYFGHSYALIADAIESATDAFSSLLLLVALRYSSKPADEDHPYGHGRIEPLITFVVVGFLIVSAITIGYQSYKNILTPHQPPESFTLWVLAVIILWKEVSYQIVIRKSKELQSTALKADAWHHRSDAISSMAAFVGIVIALILGEGYESADDWAALFAAGFILYNSYQIFRPALGEIMDENFHTDFIISIREKSMEVAGVRAIEKCYARKVGNRFLIDVHLEVDGNITVKEGHVIAHQLKDYLMRVFPCIADVLIHVEPHRMPNSKAD